ncbi:hypothetical protein L9F63_010013 [Diploptera punctata]|uniref:Uncharacterized protein n=1 Tax=Diploptera punctata TaxID=6984 RepID=A0AAD8AIA9_DIPPU|nr:hypothetical protein L9F63_010013 [Diploptera punctata]
MARLVRTESLVLDSGAGNSTESNTIKQHYYPEGGWGWIVLLCGVAVQILCHGLHLAAGIWIRETSACFQVPLMQAGTFIHITITILLL